MGFFNNIKSAYNYFRPTKSSTENFNDAQESAIAACSDMKNVGSNIHNAGVNLPIVAGQVGIGYGAFEFGAGHIVGAHAANCLAWYATPTLVTTLTSLAFTTLVTYPGPLLLATIGVAIMTDPKAIVNGVYSVGAAVGNTLTAGYHTVETGYGVAIAGVALGYETVDWLLGDNVHVEAYDVV